MWRAGALVCALATVACGRVGFDEPGDPGTLGGGIGSNGSGSPPLDSVSSLSEVGSVEIGTNVHGLLVAGDVLFVSTTRTGAELAVFDISDPTSPVEIGSADTAGNPYGMALVGTRLYVTSETGGDDLEIFDVSTPSTPQKLGGTPAADTRYRVAVSGDRAYVVGAAAGGDDLEIFDVSTPSAPSKIGGLEVLTSYYVRGVQVAEPYVYLAANSMYVVDASLPSTPTIVGEGGFYWYAYDLEISGSRVIGLESNNANSEQLRVWDVSEPTAPMLLGAADIDDSYGRDLELSGSYAVTVCAPGGGNGVVEVWDVSGVGPPPLVARTVLQEDGFAVAIAGAHIITGELLSGGPELRVFEAR